MKNALFLIVFILGYTSNILADNLKAHFTYCTFNSPEQGPYIETYLSINGVSATYKVNENGKLQSSIEITYIFKQGDSITTFKKYNLLSPELADSLTKKADFMDQQRISLPNGNYTFDVSIRDVNSDKPPFNFSQNLNIDYAPQKVTISDIELVESVKKTENKSIISKNGYDILPYTSDFYPEDFKKIAFYAEIYNSNTVLANEEGLLVNYFIASQETGSVVGNYSSFMRESAKPVIVLLNSFTIEKLPSGNYNLVVEVKNKNNESLASKKVFFQRSNPTATPVLISDDYLKSFVAKMSKEELNEAIKYIEPISTDIEKNFAVNQLKGGDEDLMRQYFFNFWSTRNNIEPELEWSKYKEQVILVNKLFSTSIKKGYVTDRGRVYLKHGKPNTRSVFPSEPNAYPYEIWHYYKIDQFSNKRFVFYSPDVVTNDYPLLHSDMPGYLNYPQWKLQLHKRTNQPRDLDTENQKGHYGSRADDFFNNPR